MFDTDTKRISRLTAILTQLQTKRLLTASELAERFSVSVRTIYRDIKALEQAEVPVVAVDGKGYSLMDNYRLPPVMFTEAEANALITAEKLVLKNKDASLTREYTEAIIKIKAILKGSIKEKVNLLAERVQIIQNNSQTTSNNLSTLQFAITNFHLVTILYSNESNSRTERTVEPFALLNTQENWLLLARCRLRNDFRFFRLDRIKRVEVSNDKFEPHPMSIAEFFEKNY